MYFLSSSTKQVDQRESYRWSWKLYCLECILAFIDVGKQRLHRQRIIKRKINQQPVVTLTKQEVENQKLQSDVLCPEPEMTVFREWWHSLSDDDVVEVKFPHERHGLAGRPSNHAMPEAMTDFLEFVDANSQPNGRQAGSYRAQYFFLPKINSVG